jgi:tRNA 2-thiouridine synthesizing protein A
MGAKPHDILDLTGLKCPLPMLMARRALKHTTPGTLVEVIADDPLAHIDLPHMCRTENIEIVDISREGARVRLLLRRP